MKGILFKPDNIKAIVEGRKTQTRRLAGLKEINKEPDKWRWCKVANIPSGFLFEKDGQFKTIHPRYRVGEVVYIKEAWAVNSRCDGLKPSEIPKVALIYYKDSELPITLGKWRSPMFMLQWAARYFIKITDVLPQRLQEITYLDARAEGILSFDRDHPDSDGGIGYNRGGLGLPMRYESTAAYMDLWNSINGKKSPWDKNDWVWRYAFELVKASS